MSVLIATFWIPMALARGQNPLKDLKRSRKRFAVFCILWVLGNLYVVPRL